MKPLTIIGALIILAGGFVLLRGFSFTKDKSVLEVGPISASVEEKQSIPPWVGGLAVGVGLVLVVAGVSSKSR